MFVCLFVVVVCLFMHLRIYSFVSSFDCLFVFVCLFGVRFVVVFACVLDCLIV